MLNAHFRNVVAATIALATSSVLLGQQPASKPLSRANLDTTCAPCTDFYEFANGGWLKSHTIPPDKSNLGSFGMLSDKNQEVVQKIVIDDALLVRDGEAKAGSNDYKIGTFYAACMDTSLMEKSGFAPIKPALNAIAAAKTTDDVVKLFGSRALRSGGGGGGGRGGAGGAAGAGGADAQAAAAAAFAPPPLKNLPEIDSLSKIAPVGLGTYPIDAVAGVGYGNGFAGNSHRHAPDGWMPAMRYMVEVLHADVNQPDQQGFTPLHHAAARGDNEMILYLVAHGANVKAVSRTGRTVVDMANGPVQRLVPLPETIALLEKLGAVNQHHCVSC